MEYPQLEYRPIDNEWGQIWSGDDCIVPRIFWKYGRPIVHAVNCHEKLKTALALANSMISSGETYSEKSKTIIEQALKEADKQ